MPVSKTLNEEKKYNVKNINPTNKEFNTWNDIVVLKTLCIKLDFFLLPKLTATSLFVAWNIPKFE